MEGQASSLGFVGKVPLNAIRLNRWMETDRRWKRKVVSRLSLTMTDNRRPNSLRNVNLSVRRDRRSKRPPRTGLQTICRKISQTLCRQRLSVEGSHKGGYPLHKGTVRFHQNGRQETGWGYTSPMGQRKMHRLGFHSHPHVWGFIPPSVVIGTRRCCGACCGSEA